MAVVRYQYRLRPGAAASATLLHEWDRCRWVRNQAVARLKESGDWVRDDALTAWRRQHGWLRDGSVVAQQQMLRNFRAKRAKGSGRRKFKSAKHSLPSLNYTRRGFAIKGGRLCLAWATRVVANHGALAIEDFKPKFLTKSRMARKSADGTIGATKTTLIDCAQRAGRKVVLVPPAYTTMTCSCCGARAKYRLLLWERVFVCKSCGIREDRDRNAARVILDRAGLNPAGAEAVRQSDLRQVRVQAEPGILAL